MVDQRSMLAGALFFAACSDDVVTATGDEATSTAWLETTDAIDDDGAGIGWTGSVPAEGETGTQTETETEPSDAGRCGDGVVQEHFEDCDDGNRDDTDDCTNNCRRTVCGDGIVEGGETCEPSRGALRCADVIEGNVPGGTVGCDPVTCQLDVSGCWTCGDGVLNTTELCDDGNDIADDECSNRCLPAACGDGIVQSVRGEDCDHGIADQSGDCVGCRWVRCGNGVIEPEFGETCDDANREDTDACTSACQPARCGDGFVQPPEICDAGGGTEGCNEDCTVGRCTVPQRFATLQAALDTAGCTEIELAPDVYEGQWTIDRDVVIEADAAGGVPLDGGGEGPVLTITAGDVTLRGLEIRGGRAERGAGITNGGSLLLENCTIVDNMAVGSEPRGGGIFSAGPLTIRASQLVSNAAQGTATAAGGGVAIVGAGSLRIDGGSRFQGNVATSASGDAFGGAIAAEGASLALEAVVLANNSAVSAGPAPTRVGGGAIHVEAGTLDLVRTLVTNNDVTLEGDATAQAFGGGVLAEDTSVSTRRTYFTLNRIEGGVTAQAGGGMSIQASGALEVSASLGESVFQGQTMTGVDLRGVGLHVVGPIELTVAASAFVHNAARPSQGTAIFLGDPEDGPASGALTAHIVNSTFSGNAGGFSGGGAVYVEGADNRVAIASSTIAADNTVDGPAGSITLRNSILLSTSCEGVTSRGFNLIGSASACAVEPQPSDLLDVDPGLHELSYTFYSGYYGHYPPGEGESPFFVVPHHPLAATSPAIDAADPAGCTSSAEGDGEQLLFDQRGDGHPRHVGRCDIGAIELQE